MTNGQKTKGRTHEQYGPEVARNWDKLVDWEKRERAYGGFFAKLLEGRGARRILDMSTGTGCDSITLLKRGFEVVSLDGSEEMLRVAEKNAERHRVRGRFVPVVADWRSMGNLLSVKFDGIICLGNSICHLVPEERSEVLRQVRNLLVDGGTFIVDYRNYDKILAGGTTGHGSYYLGDADITIKVKEGQVRPTYNLASGFSFPLSFNPIPIKVAIGELGEAGFSVTIYSDFREGYDSNAAFYQLVGKAIENPEAQIKGFYNSNAKKVNLFEDEITGNPSKFPLLHELRKSEHGLLEKGAGKKVLYFAAGSGQHILQLMKLGAEVVTLDFSEEMISLTCDRLRREGMTFKVVSGVTDVKSEYLDAFFKENPNTVLILLADIRGAEFPRDYFDWQFCYCTLPLLGRAEIQKVLERMLSWSKNGAVSIYDIEKLPILDQYYRDFGYNTHITGQTIAIEGGFEYYCISNQETTRIIQRQKKLSIHETGIARIYIWS